MTLIVDDSCDNLIDVSNVDAVLTTEGYKTVIKLTSGDVILTEDENEEEVKLVVKEIKTSGASSCICYDVI